jgi:molybdopterin converting factor small subunit
MLDSIRRLRRKWCGVISVRLYATLASLAQHGSRVASGSAELEVEARSGLTVRDLLPTAGISAADVFVVTVNDVRADLDTSLDEGDRVGLFPVLSGG